MADDVVLELGWGRLIFGQTFADPRSSPMCCAARRTAGGTSASTCRDPHVLVALAPDELFIDPSHTYRLRFTADDGRAPAPIGLHRAHTARRSRSRRDERVYAAVRDGARADRRHLGQPPHREPVDYLVAVRDDDGSVVGTVTGVDHELLFSDPEDGLQPVDAWPSIRRPACPASARR